MPKAKPLPPVELLRSRYDYDPETGVLLSRRTGRPISGSKRASVGIKRSQYLVSRVIWKMVTGEDPTNFIDHANVDDTDNRWGNLRDATRSQNNQNRRVHKSSTSGLKGVKRIRRDRDGRGLPGYLWQAAIRINGEYQYIGSFSTPEEAHEAYKVEALKLHGAFARF